jgi:hypothetical protein
MPVKKSPMALVHADGGRARAHVCVCTFNMKD